MKEKIILHQFRQSHLCIRLRWVMAWKEIPFTPQEHTRLTLDELANLTGGWRAVPALQWGGEVVVDSPKIAQFLDRKVPRPTIYPTPASPALCELLNAWIDHKVSQIAGKLLIGELLRFLPTEQERQDYVRNHFEPTHRLKVEEAIAAKAKYEKDLDGQWALLEETLRPSRFLLGDVPCYADFAAASRLRHMEIIADYRIPEKFPRLREWYGEFRRLGD